MAEFWYESILPAFEPSGGEVTLGTTDTGKLLCTSSSLSSSSSSSSSSSTSSTSSPSWLLHHRPPIVASCCIVACCAWIKVYTMGSEPLGSVSHCIHIYPSAILQQCNILATTPGHPCNNGGPSLQQWRTVVAL